MEQLIEDLQDLGLSHEQIKTILTIINKWTNDNYPVMGAVVENILKKNQLIEYPL